MPLSPTTLFASRKELIYDEQITLFVRNYQLERKKETASSQNN